MNLPLVVLQRSREYHDALMREFALITLDDEHGSAVPKRLLDLTDEVRARFQAFTTRTTEEIDAALERGDIAIDDFCRAGDLLTLATAPDVRAFREWYLGEFIRQCRGEPPRAWAG